MARSHRCVGHALDEDTVNSDGVGEHGWLSVIGEHEILFGALPGQAGNTEPQDVIGFLESLSRNRVLVGQ
jgi:hypothetical protein